MDYLASHGWQALTLDQILFGCAQGGWPERSFGLTFDDGFENFYEHGWPVLRRHGYAAIVFIVTDWVGKVNDWPGQPGWIPRQRLMAWDRLAEIARQGIEIAGHTRSHPYLSRIGKSRRADEIVGCRAIIVAHIGRPVRAFAYPFGNSSVEVEGVVAGHYAVGFSTELGFITPHGRRMALPRLDSFYLQHPATFRALGDGWLRLYLGLRRALRRLRAKLNSPEWVRS